MTFSLTKTIHIDAAREDVYDVLTSSEEIVNYFPLTRVVSDWKVGGELRLEGEVGGRPFCDYGRIEALSRAERFTYSYWSDNHGTERVPENYLTIDYRLSDDGHGTLLELQQRNLRSEQMYQVMDSIWDGLLDSLRSYLETR